MHGVVDRAESGVKKERRAAGSVDEAHRLFTDTFGEIAPILENLLAVAPQVVKIGALRLAPVVAMRKVIDTPFLKTVEIVEAVGIRYRLRRAAQMPLTGQRRFV